MVPQGLGLTRFRLVGLHGRQKALTITIRDDRVVLVGPNGAGKTTIIGSLFLILSRQWAGLLNGPKFSAMELEFGRASFAFTRRDLVKYLRVSEHEAMHRRARIRHPTIENRIVDNQRMLLLLGRARSVDERARLIRSEFAVPYVVARSVAHRLTARLGLDPLVEEDEGGGEEDEGPLFSTEKGDLNRIESLNTFLSTNLASRVLYLPTYRRIEKDLAFLFPGLGDPASRERAPASPDETRFLELVKFGMEDVKSDLAAALARLSGAARTLLNQLAGTYLRDVVREQYMSIDLARVTGIDDATLERVLDRVEERTLDDDDKKTIREIVARLREGGYPPSPTDMFTARVLEKLIDLDRDLTVQERDIKAFTQAVTSYLVDKTVNYDERSYTVSVRSEDDGREIDWSALSSGEKQIASLFGQLYLRPSEGNLAIIIDEPELSLSLPWQKRLLPDLLETGRCSFLAAATHSPFIFENSLEDYTVDLNSCAEVVS